ncbi:formate dehydrogenase subunit delta [Acuticoccus kandeliae]|uniref:formate dehydrogenase subunit delta n=1 Tax=Acuticoccus kandeliae TaxID=2073160 RepID=UPI00196B7807|nr:formate dehydrogenase subunit delta [Acuticoccus kandeliae]
MTTETRAVMMANQIAQNISAHDAAEAARATADHIAKFWDPRMRQLIFDHLAEGGADLVPAARRAVEILRDDGPPPPQSDATLFGADRSDAG